MPVETQTAVIVVTNIIVGYILWRQIKSQSEIIDKYKGLVESINPDKIISLHQRELEQLNKITTTDITQLQSQVNELSYFVVHALHVTFKESDDFNEEAFINRIMPHSIEPIKKSKEIYHANISKQ